MQLSKELLNINKELSRNGIKLRLEQRGEKLNIRGPLPCRSTSTSTTRVQRLSLGLTANEKGLKEAVQTLQLIKLQLDHQQFDWKHWSSKDDQRKQKLAENDAEKALKSFEKDFFSSSIRKRSLSGSKTTWRSAYLPYFRRLLHIEKEFDLKLTSNLFLNTLKSYKENSRSRQQCSIALNALAKHLGIVLPKDWRTSANGYGLHKAHFRELPTDKTIQECWLKIPNKKWRLAFGLMATYGLRNHEVFFSDLSCFENDGDQILRVLPHTKTGEHQVWPFHPEWVDFFELRSLKEGESLLPNINKDLSKTTLQQVGRRVSEQFRRYELPIKPYDLRHAWAIRTIHIGLPDTVSARMMGHSVNIHTKNYHHWITRRDQQKAVDDALSK